MGAAVRRYPGNLESDLRSEVTGPDAWFTERTLAEWWVERSELQRKTEAANRIQVKAPHYLSKAPALHWDLL